MSLDARMRWAVAVVVLIAAAGAWAWSSSHRRVPGVAPDAAPSVATARVQPGEIDVTVPAVGRLGPASGVETKLSFATSGRIASIQVHVGERVSAGEAVAALDTSPLALSAQQAGADAQAASAQAAAAAVDRTSTKIALDEQTIARARRLFAAGVMARKDVDAANAQLAADRADARTNRANRAAAEAQAASAQVKAQLANRDLQNGVLRAPADGVVTAVYHQAGESVDPSIAVVGIAPGSNAHVALQVAAADAARVSAGNPVHLHLPSTGATIDGRVLGVSGAVDPATQSAQVLVDAAVPSALAGSSVDAQIVVSRDHGLLIPKTAVIADPATGKTLVFVQSKDKDGNIKYDERDVRVIFENDSIAEVTGLRKSETIAAAGAFELLSSGNSSS